MAVRVEAQAQVRKRGEAAASARVIGQTVERLPLVENNALPVQRPGTLAKTLVQLIDRSIESGDKRRYCIADGRGALRYRDGAVAGMQQTHGQARSDGYGGGVARNGRRRNSIYLV